jgi:hypothetical protein
VGLFAGVDWSTVGLLALVVALEGFRRLPEGAVILRSTFGGPWRPVESEAGAGGWRIVSLWSPLTRHLVLQPVGVAPASSPPVERLRAPGWTLPALTALGLVVLLSLVLGVPVALARMGGWGLVGAVLVTEVVAIATCGIAVVAFRRLGLSRESALRRASVLLSPFTAPRAAELVLEAAAEAVPPAAVLRELMESEDFTRWARPRAFDALRGMPDTVLSTVLSSDAMRSLVSATPPGPAGPYCPRCGARFRNEIAACAGCDGVALVTR